MPWRVVPNGDRFCVVKIDSGETVACHATRAQADAQRRALYANTDYGLQLALQDFDLTDLTDSTDFARESDVNAPGGSHNLRNHWVRGPGAAKIRWGTDGSFDRCVRQLGKYVKNPQGLCAEYHKAATGEWPAEKGVESSMGEMVEAHGMADDMLTAAAKSKCGPGQHKMPDGSCMDDDSPKMDTYATGDGDEPWKGILSVEGTESGDGRLFALGSLDWEPPPQPLMYQPANVGGHNASVLVGQIQSISRHGSRIRGAGTIFGSALRSEHGENIRHMMETGGVSVDVDRVKDADVEMVYADDESGDGAGNMFAKPETTIFHRGRIRGATLVAFPAFVEAKLAFTGGTMTASVDPDSCGCEDDNPLVASVHTITIPNLPKAEWFNEPTDVKVAGALTITDNGRVYGIVAPSGTNHRSYKNAKVPRNLDFSRFHKGETIVEGGGRVVTGVITASCGHAPTENYGNLNNRLEHYDNSCSVLANVRIGYGRGGHIWAAGALNPGADPRQVAQALGCALSLDVQPHPDRPGIREFIAAHLVPVPGFPLARTQASVTYEDGMITASSVPVIHVAEPERATSSFAVYDLAKRALAASIGMDYASRKKTLMKELEMM